MQSNRQLYLRDLIYGGIDGVVTTFAIIAGAQGADLSHAVVIILGVANLVADGVSMAASNFLGTRAEDELAAERRREIASEVERRPRASRARVREQYRRRGFDGRSLDGVVATLTADRERWVDTLIDGEGGSGDGRAAWRAGVATFLAFLAAGSVPLVPYLLQPLLSGAGGVESVFGWSLALTALAFFSIGAAKALVVNTPWWRSGLETLAVGGLAAAIAYSLGDFLRSVV